jgi:hypothetical protein
VINQLIFDANTKQGALALLSPKREVIWAIAYKCEGLLIAVQQTLEISDRMPGMGRGCVKTKKGYQSAQVNLSPLNLGA